MSTLTGLAFIYCNKLQSNGNITLSFCCAIVLREIALEQALKRLVFWAHIEYIS